MTSDPIQDWIESLVKRHATTPDRDRRCARGRRYPDPRERVEQIKRDLKERDAAQIH